MKLSIVATLYRSARYIAEFHQRATAAAKEYAGDDYEIVLVNDGSPDNSVDIAVQLTEQDPHVVVVDLSRNFGHHKAMMTGLMNAKGDHVYLIDVDLEEEPEWLMKFAAQMAQEKCDVVYGVQETRKGGRFEQFSGTLFYRIFRGLTGLNLPNSITTARLMTRRYVDALTQHQEREVFMAGLWYITGFHQVAQIVKKHSAGASTYTFKKKMALMVNSITAFSSTPLISIFYLGMLASAFSALYIVYIIAHWAFFAAPLTGWSSVMASIWLLGGLILLSIGVVGIYLSKIFSEIKGRPYTIIRQIYQKGN